MNAETLERRDGPGPRRRLHEVPGLSDRELLAHAGDDPEAFALFYRRHATQVLSYFLRRTACGETAADLTAETFAQAFMSRRRYKPRDAPAAAWLFAIARHQLAHFVRSANVARRARRRLGLPLAYCADEGFDRVEELVDLGAERQAIRQAAHQLPAPIAEALHLRILEEMSYREVAARLGCTEAAARQRVARGLSRLADDLGDHT